MTVFGYHASHEQIAPSILLAAVQRAEQIGFDAAMCSDHLAPWGLRQGESGFAWSWLGAALATTSFPIGVVTAPGQRYHPVIIAQAVATLAEMFPGRFWAAYGSGEAVNEHVTGDEWPDKESRMQRLEESVSAVARLLRGERVSLEGAVRIHDARIWSLPERTPPVIAAATSGPTARWAAGWAEGLITVGADQETTSQVLSAYRERDGVGEAMLQIHVSLGDTVEEALATAKDQWRQAAVPAGLMWDLQQPEDFDARAEPDDEVIRSAVAVASTPEELAESIAAAAIGFDHVYIHDVGEDQRRFLDQAPALLRRLREGT
ncbi:putative non-F420 flavinoid oxidoreductase [Brevibacterium sanguinis]|uniref:Non-F420 flavinoid oxidoreductase n=2 Tax=Brevibacterium TaxID=1696 RepID=A0ABX9GTT8_9MICO|nr:MULTISPECIES: TIGR03557 family F420-dependent LLM class oxidoreductase [Brevibacterium]RBP66210.1 putative non-F420 flavinoid oxidoreductase [Brevibacterium sanguinis]RBP72861.1 putative non-F420 flavinoid oxidoreductase [Brevibacterium celere]